MPLPVVSGSASAAWVKVSVSDAGGTYVDTATIRRAGDFVKMSGMTYYKIVADPPLAYKPVQRQYEFDCKATRFRMLSTTGYAGPMGKGDTVIGAGTPSAAWGQSSVAAQARYFGTPRARGASTRFERVAISGHEQGLAVTYQFDD
jgi:hypothetical protein